MKKNDVKILIHDLNEFIDLLEDAQTNIDFADVVWGMEQHIKGLTNRIYDEMDDVELNLSSYNEWKNKELE